MIVQVGNTIVPYKNIKIYEKNDEDIEEDEEYSDTMHMYKEIGVGTYVISQKIIEEDIRKLGR